MGCQGCVEKKRAQRSKQGEKPSRKILDDRIVRMRLAICKGCEEVKFDEAGEPTKQRLYGVVAGKMYCGNPNNPETKENPQRFGLGLELLPYTKMEARRCPRGTWGPGRQFASTVLPIFTEPEGEALPGVFDFIGPTRTLEGLTDCTGIGDTAVQSVVAQAVALHNKEKGILTRFVTIRQRLDWAKFFTNGMPVESLSDDKRVPGEFAAHTAPMMALEIDATARLNGLNRHSFLATRFGLDPGATSEWKFHINEEAEKKAKEFLRHPLREKRPIICMAPLTNSGSRQWPLRHWAHLVNVLIKAGVAVFIISHPFPDDKPHFLKGIPVRRFGSDDPHEVAAILKHSTIVVGNDSGMPHMAGFVGTRSLALCGPTDGRVVFGGWNTVEWMQGPSGCTGCLWFQDNGWKPWCGFGCESLSDLKPLQVRDKVLDVAGRA